MSLTMDDIPQEKQDVLEIACKEIEWMEEEVTVESVEQYLRRYMSHREPVLPSLIRVFVVHWNAPVEQKAV